MKICVYLITTHMIIFMNSLSVVDFHCYMPVSKKGFETVVCNVPERLIDSENFNETLMRLPRNISNLTKHLDIHAHVGNRSSIGIRLPIEVDCIDMFLRMPSLNFLLIMGRNFSISEELRSSPDQMDLLQKNLFNLTNLKVLAVSMNESRETNLTIGATNSTIGETNLTIETNTTEIRWILPKSLKRLAVETVIEEYDLRGCPKLEKLSVRFGNLSTLPPLYVPVPPIKVLRFVGCPLNNLTVNDIAGFCQLEKLIINTSLPDAPYNISIGKCQCIQLHQWINRLVSWRVLEFDGSLPCAADENSTMESCPKSNLDEAMRLRKRCLEKIGPHRAAILYLAAAIVMLPVVFVCVANIRSYWKIHAKPPVTTVKPTSSMTESETETDSSIYEE